MERCTKHEEVIERITKTEARSESNTHRLAEQRDDIEDLKKVHSAIMSLDSKFNGVNSQLENMNDKIDVQQEILKGQVELFKPHEKSIKQIIIETVIPLMVYGSILIYAANILKGVKL